MAIERQRLAGRLDDDTTDDEPEWLLLLGEELGQSAGEYIAQTYATEFVKATPFQKSRLIGKVIGYLGMEVVLWEVLAPAMAARAPALIGRLSRSSKLVRRLIELVQEVPGLRRALGKLGRMGRGGEEMGAAVARGGKRGGKETGSYLSPEGESFEKRALAPSSLNDPYYAYQVLRPIPVEAGRIAPAFDQPGGGTQYKIDWGAVARVTGTAYESMNAIPGGKIRFLLRKGFLRR